MCLSFRLVSGCPGAGRDTHTPSSASRSALTPCYSHRVRGPSAIRKQGGDAKRSNIIGERLRAARHLHTPRLTLEQVHQRASALSEFAISMSTVAKIEQGVRHAYDFEVMALALATSVDARWLLGLTDDPGPLLPLPLPSQETKEGRG